MFNIIIPLHNNRELTARCLDSLQRHIPRDRSDVRVVVVDDNSTDDTQECLARWSEFAARKFALRVLTNDTNMGFAQTCNRGLMEVVSDDPNGIVLFLNNDTELLDSNAFDEIEKSLSVGELNIGIVGGLLFYPSRTMGRAAGRVQHAGMGFVEVTKPVHLYRGMSPQNAPGILKQKVVQCVTGAVMGMTVRDAIEMRGFDTEFVNGYEDIDLCFRLRFHNNKRKYCVYNPNVRFLHHEGMSGPKRFLHESHNHQLFTKRHLGRIVIDYDYLISEDGGVSIDV